MAFGRPSALTRGSYRDGRRTLCAAEGVLAALQHCSLDDAFLDIIGTARRHNVAPLRLATALVSRVQGDPDQESDEAVTIAIDEAWGPLLTNSTQRAAAEARS
ncbi:hypothetical protein [Mycolicibacterium iranicum]|uniref:ANTAR domain-containing protein n=1 Tax=Mycolicibacterium iranicum TaxID=912594 RepID=A0A178M0Y5_MYCIR|nr:hypothetical protein [Mycolicibacterium iranicum]OAN39882.1 hypothetical protein A4X20_16145 [Mycolicibacterium iranicum]